MKALQQVQSGLKAALQARLKAAVAGTAGAMDTSAAAEPSAEAWPWALMLLLLRDYATFDYAK